MSKGNRVQVYTYHHNGVPSVIARLNGETLRGLRAIETRHEVAGVSTVRIDLVAEVEFVDWLPDPEN